MFAECQRVKLSVLARFGLPVVCVLQHRAAGWLSASACLLLHWLFLSLLGRAGGLFAIPVCQGKWRCLETRCA